MSRPIKFKVWDKLLQKFIPWSNSLSFDDKTLEFLQFTGLTDKSGADIFEGDIILCCDNSPDFYTEVKYQPPFWLAKSPNGNNVFFWNYHFLKFEVAGNIYENPELLEK